ncbi:MAG: DUF4010 domain-containing protein [Hyphomonadaceae bacterium]|jgi:uncharacterized membrane protein (DUF4010 family)|nr:DUF4010 domain-containing protein [Hyphomonadaceae bacterium]
MLHSNLDVELFQRLAVALAIGVVIGIERGWEQREDAEGERAAGLRTHALAALLGGVWGAIARGLGNQGTIMLGLAFVAFAAAIIVFRLREIRHQGTFGATTVVASMMAFALGVLAVVGDTVAASAAGVATAIFLALKGALHAWLRRLTWEELRAGLLLLAMTVILLPILPDRELGPFGALNPHEIWFMTVLVAAVSFVGYLAIKVAGDRRGVLLSGLAGGMVSSTAVTISMARLARDHAERHRLFASGALLANVAMMVRVLIIASFFNAGLLRWLVPPLALAAIAQAATVGILLRDQKAGGGVDKPLSLKNPFELDVVLAFGGLLTLILLLGKVLTVWAGTRGALALAAASGVADVDAITLSMARLGRSELSVETAAFAILLAIVVNTVAKTVLAWVSGGRAPGRLILFAAIAAFVAGLVGLQLTALCDPAGWFR